LGLAGVGEMFKALGFEGPEGTALSVVADEFSGLQLDSRPCGRGRFNGPPTGRELQGQAEEP
jgi:hypothetical protein